MWTGYVVEDFDDNQKQIFNYVDVLVDGKFEEDKKDLSLTMRGSRNQRVIDVKKTLFKQELVLFNMDK